METARAVCGAALLAFCLWGLYDVGLEALDMPEVLMSTGTGECVDVRDPASEADGQPSPWSCDHLPPRYDRIMVR